MSFEGYYQKLCRNGHLTQHDVYDYDSKYEFACPYCGERFVWFNTVDQTNGMCDFSCDTPRCSAQLNECDTCDKRIDGFVQLEVDVPATTERCNLGHDHITAQTRYKIPTDKGHMIEEENNETA